MLLRSLLSISFVFTAFAAPIAVRNSLEKRDLPKIQAALNNVNTALKGLDDTVKGTENPSLGAGISILNAVTSVKASIEDATVQVQSSEVLNKQDSINLKAGTDALTNNVKVTINDVIAKKTLVDRFSASPLVAVGLQDQKTASIALAGALVSKVAPEMNDVAQQSAQALSTVLDRGIQVFSSAAAATSPAAAPATPANPVAADGVASCNQAAPATSPANGAAAAAPAQQPTKGLVDGFLGLIGGIL